MQRGKYSDRSFALTTVFGKRPSIPRFGYDSTMSSVHTEYVRNTLFVAFTALPTKRTREFTVLSTDDPLPLSRLYIVRAFFRNLPVVHGQNKIRRWRVRRYLSRCCLQISIFTSRGTPIFRDLSACITLPALFCIMSSRIVHVALECQRFATSRGNCRILAVYITSTRPGSIYYALQKLGLLV